MIRLLFLLTIVVASCTPAPTESERFERKARCALLWHATQERIRREEPDAMLLPYLEEMFYSPSADTCIAAYEVVYRHSLTDAPAIPQQKWPRLPNGDLDLTKLDTTPTWTATTLFVIKDALSWNTLFLKNIEREASAEADWTLRRAELKNGS